MKPIKILIENWRHQGDRVPNGTVLNVDEFTANWLIKHNKAIDQAPVDEPKTEQPITEQPGTEIVAYHESISY